MDPILTRSLVPIRRLEAPGGSLASESFRSLSPVRSEQSRRREPLLPLTDRAEHAVHQRNGQEPDRT